MQRNSSIPRQINNAEYSPVHMSRSSDLRTIQETSHISGTLGFDTCGTDA